MIEDIETVELVVLDYLGQEPVNKVLIFENINSSGHRIAKALENLKDKNRIRDEKGFIHRVRPCNHASEKQKHGCNGRTGLINRLSVCNGNVPQGV